MTDVPDRTDPHEHLPPPPSSSPHPGRRHPFNSTTVVLIVLFALVVVAGSVLVVQRWANGRPLPKDEFLARANAICQRMEDESDALQSTIGSSLAFSEWPAVYRSGADLLERGIDDLSSLPSPEGNGDVLESLYGDSRQLVDLLQRLADEAEGGNRVPAGQLLKQVERDNSAAERRYLMYGLTECR